MCVCVRDLKSEAYINYYILSAGVFPTTFLTCGYKTPPQTLELTVFLEKETKCRI